MSGNALNAELIWDVAHQEIDRPTTGLRLLIHRCPAPTELSFELFECDYEEETDERNLEPTSKVSIARLSLFVERDPQGRLTISGASGLSEHEFAEVDFWLGIQDRRFALKLPEEGKTRKGKQAEPSPSDGGDLGTFELGFELSDGTHTLSRLGSQEILQVPNPNPSVKACQAALRHLGFLLLSKADADHGTLSRATVREFQIYAGMEYVARWTGPEDTPAHEVEAKAVAGSKAAEPSLRGAAWLSSYVAQLERVRNERRYEGPVHGELDGPTVGLIEHWQREGLRCPVVIEAWNSDHTSLKKGHLWDRKAVGSKDPRVFAHDLSGAFELPEARRSPPYVVVGYQAKAGPNVSPKSGHCWSEAEVTPPLLVGKDLLDEDELSTFRVLRAVSEKECYGYLDCVNGWDNAFISVGPCHWTLPIRGSGGAIAKGELGGLLAYLRERDGSVWTERFGLRADAESWAKTYSSSSRKYSDKLALRDVGGWSTHLPELYGKKNKSKRINTGMNPLRTWHWFYRWVMAGRALDEDYVRYRRGMWDGFRQRILDVLSAKLDDERTLQDVFTSEWSVGCLIRWHIWRPAHLVKGGKATERIRNAVKATVKKHGSDPSAKAWGEAGEKKLVEGLKAAAKTKYGAEKSKKLRGFMDSLARWKRSGEASSLHYSLDLADHSAAVAALRTSKGEGLAAAEASARKIGVAPGSFRFETTGLTQR